MNLFFIFRMVLCFFVFDRCLSMLLILFTKMMVGEILVVSVNKVWMFFLFLSNYLEVMVDMEMLMKFVLVLFVMVLVSMVFLVLGGLKSNIFLYGFKSFFVNSFGFWSGSMMSFWSDFLMFFMVLMLVNVMLILFVGMIFGFICFLNLLLGEESFYYKYYKIFFIFF